MTLNNAKEILSKQKLIIEKNDKLFVDFFYFIIDTHKKPEF